MPISLDRNGKDKEIQKWIKTIKKDFAINTESKGDAKAVRELMKWYVTIYKANASKRNERMLFLEETEENYENLKHSLKEVISHLK